MKIGTNNTLKNFNHPHLYYATPVPLIIASRLIQKENNYPQQPRNNLLFWERVFKLNKKINIQKFRDIFIDGESQFRM